MTEYMDYRNFIVLQQGACNASFMLCFYKGKERKFFHIIDSNGRSTFGHIVDIRKYNNNTLALKISNYYENWKEYLVPSHLTVYNISSDELIKMNRGEIWLNSD
jgi:hypothetical protein